MSPLIMSHINRTRPRQGLQLVIRRAAGPQISSIFRRASAGFEALPSLARRVSMQQHAELPCRGNRRGGNPACGVAPPVETDDDKRTHVYHRTLASGILWLLFGNGDVSGWRGKRNRPRWKTSTEWQRRETVANHAAGIAPSAPTRSLEVTRCGSTESRENNRIHLGPRGRNGPLGAKLVNGRVCPEAAPLQWWQSVHGRVHA